MMSDVDRRLSMLLAPGRVVSSSDAASVLGLCVRIGPYELRENVPQFGLHGVVSHPLPGADVVVVHRNGDPSQPVVVAVNDQVRRKRATLPGDIGLAHDGGHSVMFVAGGIVVDGHGLPVTVVNASVVTVKGPVRIEGDLSVTGQVTAQCDAAAVHLTTHTHPTAAPGGPSAPTPGS